jgi:hypothetical protein
MIIFTYHYFEFVESAEQRLDVINPATHTIVAKVHTAGAYRGQVYIEDR